ncbi:hypothetical protein CTAYLR_006809 [Chrysophaeum taylorii]|uniref:Phosphoglycerate mutase n=1 Tax=Chrysophaeum taylorii TaxID=2483200 RepID=A0AAD7UC91_9STRA|nr:hypothetical protein CTAYLR_006809 [Chrysophaeum taylorii]
MPFSNVYESVVTAALSASLVSLILLDARSIQQIVDKLRLFTMGLLFMLFGRDKRWKRRPPDSATVSALSGRRVRRIYLVRHGESEWNLIFNKGSKLLLPFKAIAALVREILLFVHLDPDSILYDSPLNQQGLEQAQEIAAWLRENPDSLPEPSLVVSSNLRRALQTVVIALQDRFVIQDNDAPKQQKRVHVLSSLQEVSTNVDTVSLLAPHATPTLPRVPELLQAPARFEVSRNYGNKSLRGTGRDRIIAFCDYAFESAHDSIIVGCHSLWARFFFRELLPSDVNSVAKDSKIANGGIVSCDLISGNVNNITVYAIDPDSVQVVYKGFDSKVKLPISQQKPKAA